MNNSISCDNRTIYCPILCLDLASTATVVWEPVEGIFTLYLIVKPNYKIIGHDILHIHVHNAMSICVVYTYMCTGRANTIKTSLVYLLWNKTYMFCS